MKFHTSWRDWQRDEIAVVTKVVMDDRPFGGDDHLMLESISRPVHQKDAHCISTQFVSIYLNRSDIEKIEAQVEKYRKQLIQDARNGLTI